MAAQRNPDPGSERFAFLETKEKDGTSIVRIFESERIIAFKDGDFVYTGNAGEDSVIGHLDAGAGGEADRD